MGWNESCLEKYIKRLCCYVAFRQHHILSYSLSDVILLEKSLPDATNLLDIILQVTLQDVIVHGLRSPYKCISFSLRSGDPYTQVIYSSAAGTAGSVYQLKKKDFAQ